MEDNSETVVVVTDVGTATVEPVLLIEEDVVEPDVVVVVVVNDAGRLYRCGYREDDGYSIEGSLLFGINGVQGLYCLFLWFDLQSAYSCSV